MPLYAWTKLLFAAPKRQVSNQLHQDIEIGVQKYFFLTLKLIFPEKWNSQSTSNNIPVR